jgi:hypothetical protein
MTNDDDFVDFRLTDTDGQEIRVYFVAPSNGMIWRWPDGRNIVMNKEQMKMFMTAVKACIEDGKPLTVDIKTMVN